MANEVGSAPPASPRLVLARLARDTALAVEGVASVGPRPVAARSTRDGDDRLHGVVATAEPGGGHAVSLYLAAEPVRLPALAERVRDRVMAAARRTGLGDELRSVDIVIEDIVEPSQ